MEQCDYKPKSAWGHQKLEEPKEPVPRASRRTAHIPVFQASWLWVLVIMAPGSPHRRAILSSSSEEWSRGILLCVLQLPACLGVKSSTS